MVVNKRSLELVKKKFYKIYKMTHTQQYYNFGIQYITRLYKDILCSYNPPLIWYSKQKELIGYYWITNLSDYNCDKRFIFIALSLNLTHANGLLVDTKTKKVRRIEPHGGVVNIDASLGLLLKKIFNNQGYTYEFISIECPYLGIQASSGETFGLCQTAVLYLLGTYIDSETFLYKYYDDNRLAKAYLLEFACFLLVEIRKNLKPQSRKLFDNYNNLTEKTKYDLVLEFGI